MGGLGASPGLFVRMQLSTLLVVQTLNRVQAITEMPLNVVPHNPQYCASNSSDEQLIFEDNALGDIDSGLKAKLQSFPFPSFIGSPGYCESYVFPPVQRIAYLVDRSGTLREVLFYNEHRIIRFLRAIDIIGPVDPQSELVQRVVRARRPSLLTFSMQIANSFPQSAAGQELFELRVIAGDYKIVLPAKTEEYLGQLGKQTRKHLPYYARRLQREWGADYAFKVVCGAEISWDSFTSALELNRLRMRGKRRLSLWSAAIAKHRWPLFRSRGMLSTLLCGDSIVAATLSLLHGKEAYLIVLAHDPQYDRLNVGNVCLWKTIEHLIESRYTAFHLMWGDSFYKTQFCGRQEVLRNACYSASPSIVPLVRFLHLAERSNPLDFWRKVQRKLAGYLESMPRSRPGRDPIA